VLEKEEGAWVGNEKVEEEEEEENRSISWRRSSFHFL
jgi:hypothetical protein